MKLQLFFISAFIKLLTLLLLPKKDKRLPEPESARQSPSPVSPDLPLCLFSSPLVAQDVCVSVCFVCVCEPQSQVSSVKSLALLF